MSGFGFGGGIPGAFSFGAPPVSDNINIPQATTGFNFEPDVVINKKRKKDTSDASNVDKTVLGDKSGKNTAPSMIYWYNNAEDSDVDIILNSGETIRAHKLILKNSSEMIKKMLSTTTKMRENDKNKIAFPSYNDDVVTETIKHCYGIYDLSTLTIETWRDRFLFAHYLIAADIINNLVANIPVTTNVGLLVKTACLIEGDYAQNILKYIVNICKVADNATCGLLAASLIPLDLAEYKFFRTAWHSTRVQAASMLLLPHIESVFWFDCMYIGGDPDRLPFLHEFVQTIRFHNYSLYHFERTINTPAVIAVPSIRHLLECIMHFVKK